MVLVQDGPVAEELAAEIAGLMAESPVPVTHVEIPDNLGLGPALDAGLRAAEHEIVARMDADDISVPDRFEKQLPLIEAGADIVGSGVEFGDVDRGRRRARTPPTDPDEIRRVVRFRDPFNHPTVVYRRSAVLAAGGYADMALMEDYLLFTRMVTGVPSRPTWPTRWSTTGSVTAPTRAAADDSCCARSWPCSAGSATSASPRRRQYLRNVAVRGGYRLVPEGVRKVAYRRLLANRSGTARG